MLDSDNGEDLTALLPVLSRVAPDVVQAMTQPPAVMGSLLPDRRVLVSARAATQCLELIAVRVDAGRVMLVILDVTQERRLAEREHALAIELQQAMLGRIDRVDGIDVCATYRATEDGRLVGGDWYDLIRLPAGHVGLVVGDAVGHSVAAAAAMGQLRTAVRAMAPWCADPAEMLQRADDFAERIDGAFCTTLAYAVLEPGTGAMCYASAGHPPPLVVSAQGSGQFLEGGRRVPLGCPAAGPVETAWQRLAPGDTVIFYTDGLVERRGESLAAGLARLQACAGDLVTSRVANLSAALVDSLVQTRLEDDVCVLAVHYPGPPSFR